MYKDMSELKREDFKCIMNYKDLKLGEPYELYWGMGPIKQHAIALFVGEYETGYPRFKLVITNSRCYKRGAIICIRLNSVLDWVCEI